MEIIKTSLILDFLDRIRASFDNSVTRKIFNAILALWDKLVSGSLVVGFLIGQDLGLMKVTDKPSFFAQSISGKWSGFLANLGRIDSDDSSYSKAKFANYIKLFARLFVDRPLWTIGWIGLAFLPVYGSLMLLTAGLSMNAVILILISILISVLLTFSTATLPQIIDGSVFVKFLDGCDE